MRRAILIIICIIGLSGLLHAQNTMNIHKTDGTVLRLPNTSVDKVTYGLQVPTLQTIGISNITDRSAVTGGTITDDGADPITLKGVCYGTSPNPTILSTITANGSGNVSYSSTITGLTANTTYYVRAYATNNTGTAYGSEVSFTTKSQIYVPTLTTSLISDITNVTAQSGGTIISNGGGAITQSGICWSTSNTPTISNNIITGTIATGNYTSKLTALTPNTLYYVRSYATNLAGTGYGDVRAFSTLPSVYGTVTDKEGNIYKTVTIGTQIWMAENLKATKYNDGTTIPLQTDYTLWKNLTTPAYCWYNNDPAVTGKVYGALYNYYVVSTQKICPVGWSVPTDTRFNLLVGNLGGINKAGNGLKEAGLSHWVNGFATNISGFTALPGGMRDVPNGLNYSNLGYYGYFWTQDYFSYNINDGQPITAWFYMFGLGDTMLRSTLDVKNGYSIRCIKD